MVRIDTTDRRPKISVSGYGVVVAVNECGERLQEFELFKRVGLDIAEDRVGFVACVVQIPRPRKRF